MPLKSKAHRELERLEQRIADARRAAREAEQVLVNAEAAVEAARDAVREAHDLGSDAGAPTRKLDRAKRDVEQAALAREGVGQRVKRAIADHERYLAEHGEQLLSELQPECEQAAENLRTAAEALIAADSEWGRLSQVVARYLRGLSLSPAENSRAEHELSGFVRELRRALAQESARQRRTYATASRSVTSGPGSASCARPASRSEHDSHSFGSPSGSRRTQECSSARARRRLRRFHPGLGDGPQRFVPRG
jgi:ABC-type transporter Mla subunit MlaD